jgi:glycerate kinase
MLGSGAGGGIGYAALALGGSRLPGVATVLGAAGAPARIAAADLVITGEGALDWQSLQGKVVSGVAAAALQQARPVVALVGRCDIGRREWAGCGISAVYTLIDEAGSAEAAVASPSAHLRATATRAARSWSRPVGGMPGGV